MLFAAVISGALLSSEAQAQTCTAPAGWRAPLTYVCPNQPAIAQKVNDNYGQIVTWLEAKVGQVGMPLVLANDSVTLASIAPNAVGTSELVDGSVTKAKMAAGGLALYSITDNRCAGQGSLTLASQCSFQTAACGICNGSFGVVGFFDCSGSCTIASATCLTAPATCPLANTLRGYLVAP